jgi:multiple sugar transport system substrate-binding protein
VNDLRELAMPLATTRRALLASAAVFLAAALVMPPLVAHAADLTVWWEKGFNPEEDQAARETVAAFEHKTGKTVELASPTQDDMRAMVQAALDAGHPPDFLFGTGATEEQLGRWAFEGRLVDLTDALGPLAAQFDRDALDWVTLLDGTTGRRGLYALPMTRYTNHVHVWRGLLARAGFTLADIPKGWEAFWSFWCDNVQPAVRKAAGRDDLWGVGLAMSASAADTEQEFLQFVHAYGADYVTPDGQLVIDEPAVRAGLVKALDGYTGLYRKGCTPPASLGWNNTGNNQAFLAGSVVMTPNTTLSIPNALKTARPGDYSKDAATIAWPDGVDGRPLAILTMVQEAVVFRAGGHDASAKEFVRFLVGEGWLAHWLDFAGDRFLPPMTTLLNSPFWLDPGDQHRMAAAMQFLTQPRDYDYAVASGDWRHFDVYRERIRATAVHRVVTDGPTPGQAVAEAVARIHQILSE